MTTQPDSKSATTAENRNLLVGIIIFLAFAFNGVLIGAYLSMARIAPVTLGSMSIGIKYTSAATISEGIGWYAIPFLLSWLLLRSALKHWPIAKFIVIGAVSTVVSVALLWHYPGAANPANYSSGQTESPPLSSAEIAEAVSKIVDQQFAGAAPKPAPVEAVQGDSQRADSNFVLICTIRPPSSSVDSVWTIPIDVENSTAQGFPARITDSSISWSNSGAVINIDRYSGSILVVLGNPPVGATGSCVRRTDALF